MKIQITGTEDMPDGSIKCEVEMDAEMESFLLESYDVDAMSEELMTKIVTEALEHYIACHDEKE